MLRNANDITRPAGHRTRGLWADRAAAVSGPRRGFTLIEVLIAIVIISVIAGLIIVAVGRAMSTARQQAGEATVRGMGVAVEQFAQQFGFPPPIVYDGQQGASTGAMTLPPVIVAAPNITLNAPVDAVPNNGSLRMVAAYNQAFPDNSRVLRGIPQGGGGSAAELITRYTPGTPEFLEANQRYSKYSLAYYLAGALPSAVDGVDGGGFVRPLADGTFQGVTAAGANVLTDTMGQSTSRERFEPFYEPSSGSARLVREYIDPDEYAENAGNLNAANNASPSQTDWRHAAIVDGNGKAYRYYRWLPSNPDVSGPGTLFLNIPYVLLDDQAVQELINAGPGGVGSVDLTGGDMKLRGASWAIVGAGPDGLFGTEPIEMLRGRLGSPPDTDEDWGYRALAKSDNVVEVGG